MARESEDEGFVLLEKITLPITKVPNICAKCEASLREAFALSIARKALIDRELENLDFVLASLKRKLSGIEEIDRLNEELERKDKPKEKPHD